MFVPAESSLGILFTWPFFPQIGWAVPTVSLAYLPALTADDEFHAGRPLAQVQMSTGRAGNRYKQPATLFILFSLTYFSTRNSNTQVSASNPVLLFHCSCHQSWDTRTHKKKEEEGSVTEERSYGRLHEPLSTGPAFSFTKWTLQSLWSTFAKWTVITKTFPPSMSFILWLISRLKAGGVHVYSDTSNVQVSSLMELCTCIFSVHLWYFYIHADVKNWVAVQNLMWKTLHPKCFTLLLKTLEK